MSIFHFIAVLLLLPVVILMAIRHLGRWRVSVPSCPRCFYNVTGLTSNVCPECGANLNEVGVLEPGEMKPLGRVAYAMIWTVVLGAVALLVSPEILQYVPQKWSVMGERVFASPKSGLYNSVTLTGTHIFRLGEDGRAQVLTLTLNRNDGATSVLMADYNARECRFIDVSEVKRPLAFNNEEPTETLLMWFEANGIKASASLVKEAQLISSALKDQMWWRTSGTGPGKGWWPDYFATRYGTSMSVEAGIAATRAPTNFQRLSETHYAGPWRDPWPLRILIVTWVTLWLVGSGADLDARWPQAARVGSRS